MSIRLIGGDCREVLATLPADSVHCVVTSPPYYGLRDYGVDGQIGLEATPDAYLAEMVAVFREVRRVMRHDATLWLNMGGGYQNKQLDMMPARLALMLQQPYYTGTIKSEADRVWLAAMIDTEGCFFIHKRKAGTSSYAKYTRADGTEANYARTQDTYGVGLEIANTSKALIDRVAEIVPGGTFVTQGPEQNERRKQTIYRWRVGPNEVKRLAQELYPHLVAKQHQARLIFSCPSSGERGAAAHQAMMDLHNGASTSVDYPVPPSLFEPGFYLRSDIIWGKPNPMPESVTDRPTSAHEHVFLLAKSARYFYDADAVREPHEEPGRVQVNAGARPRSLVRAFVAGDERGYNPAGRSCRNVWTIATAPYSEAHFATFPPALAERCIRAGTSERGCCAACGAPWARVVERTAMVLDRSERTHPMGRTRTSGTMIEPPTSTTTGWAPSCACAADVVPCRVLDCFAGAGTTLLVADRLQRDAIGVELSPDYTRMAMDRCRDDAPLFAEPSPPPAEPPEEPRIRDLFA
jgi:DNA modification methylase